MASTEIMKNGFPIKAHLLIMTSPTFQYGFAINITKLFQIIRAFISKYICNYNR